jgi:HSP20 family protein
MTQKTEGQLAVDIYQTDTEIVVLAPIAGIKPDAVDISVTDQVLTIKGERHIDQEAREEDYVTRECFWGSFSRAIILPETANVAKIAANFENAVLEIRIPVIEKVKSKVIKIQKK